MYIRAGMNSFLDPTVGKLDTISAEPLRVWHVTGSDAAIEAFRAAVGGVVLPDEDVVAVKTAADMAIEVAAKVARKVEIEASLASVVAELVALQPSVPVITAVSIVSSNIDPTKAVNGDVITLTFTADTPVTKLDTFLIAGKIPDSFANVDLTYTATHLAATHLVDTLDPIVGVPVAFNINVKNTVGTKSATVTETTDASAVIVAI